MPTSRITSGSPSRAAAASAQARVAACRTLREPHDPRVMAEIFVAQLGMAVEAELANDGVLERAGEEVRQEVRARLLLSAAATSSAREHVVAMITRQPRQTERVQRAGGPQSA